MPARIKYILIWSCICTGSLLAQNHNNPGGTVNACTGNFYDTGGPSGTYGTDEEITTTICPTASNKCVSITFTAFDLELNYDELTIYDGPTTTYPAIGTYTGTVSPGTVTAHNGCLTFYFESDFSVNRAGWRATIDCVPCPPPPPCTGTTPNCAITPPDDCANACHLGTLTTPAPCPSTGTAVNVFCVSNMGATSTTPYLYLNGCQPAGTNMAAPAADVWYSFIASSNIIDISVTGMSSPNIGLYEGNDCSTFVGRGCAVGQFGNLVATFQPITPGRKYYLQISGNDTNETADMTLRITGRNDCDPCVITANLTASPLPTNGVYQSGTTVHFCFSVTQWNPTSINWLHGIVPVFGDAWDMSTLVVYPPNSCDGNGHWDWYNSVTSGQTGFVTGPGFFYESILGCTTCNPNNPGDNYGDNCTGTVNFVFCWDITSGDCSSGNNLNVSVNTFGDGETGSWTNYACAADPVFDFLASCTSCPEPVLTLRGAACNGAATGRAIAEGQGTPPYDFVWRNNLGNVLKTSNGVVDFDTLNGLRAGSYSIEQSDAGQCTNTVTFTITEPAALTQTISVSNITCSGLQDGSLNISASGGTLPYEYSLNGINYQSSNVFSGLASGSYTVTLRDDSNCIITRGATISETALVIITPDAVVNSSCSLDNGSISVTVSGGIIPYSFVWSNSALTEDITGLPPGVYILTVEDANNCTATDTFIVTENPGLTLSLSSVNVQCNGGTDGSIDLTVSGGTAPFVFAWSNSAISEDLNGIIAGIYSVTVSDVNQCADTATAAITEPPPINLGGVVSNLFCNGDNSGSVDLSVSGGITPYVFLWSDNSNAEDLSGVPAGNYSVTVNDGNACFETISFTVTEPAELALSYTKTDVSCGGGNNGAINLSVSGGTVPYQFIWSNNETTEDLSALIAGVYDITVTDLNACTETASVTISESATLIVNGLVTDVLCNGDHSGVIDLTVNGGVSPYSYQWSNNAVSEDLNRIIAGSYSVTVSDVNQCSDILDFVVTEPPAIVLSGVATHLLCTGDNSGAIDLSVNGGVAPYYFLWSSNALTEDLTGVAAGNYSVTVTDGNACLETISFTVTEPAELALSYTKTDVSCGGGNNGAIDLSVSGGTVPYQFIWSNNATTEDVAGLGAGVYVVRVFDANFCEADETITINEPGMLAVNGQITDVLCHGENTGAINITVNGGVPPYGFLWSNNTTLEDMATAVAGSYSVTVTDFNQCADTSTYLVREPLPIMLTGAVTNLACNVSNSGSIDLTALGGVPPYSFLWSNNATTEDISGLAAGSYSVTAIDYNACTAIASFDLTQPDFITLSLVKTDVSCAGGDDGAINLTVINGTQPYQFIWTNNAATEDISGLAAGVYGVMVIDSNSCTATSSATIAEPPPLVVNGTVIDVACSGDDSGNIDLTVTGGVAPYGYQWSNSALSEDLNGIGAGHYMVTVSDANQCTYLSDFVVTEPPAIFLTGVATNLLCNADYSGAIDLTAAGGVQPFSYLWSNNATTEDVTGLAAGMFSVTATDNNGCSMATSFLLSQPGAIQVTESINQVSCAQGHNGIINITVNGGTPPYQFYWSNSSTTEDIIGLMAGNYDVAIIDMNGCNATASYTITEPSPIVVTGSSTHVLCAGESTGTVDIDVNGGIAPYNYQWSNAATTEDLAAVSAGTYIITVYDVNNCTATNGYVVNEPDPLLLTGFAADARCFASADGEIHLSATGGTPPYEFSNGTPFQPSPSFMNVPGGNYFPVVRDANNCTDTINLIINAPPPITTATSSDSVSCFGGNDGVAFVIASGTNSPFSYLWSNSETTDAVHHLSAGTYFVTVTDDNNCPAYDTAIVGEPAAIVLTAVINNLNCKGDYSGSIDLNVAGGTPGYAYLWSGNQTTQEIDSLSAGIYSVTVTDNNYCTASNTYAVSEPAAINLSVSTTPPVCSGDSNGVASVTANGGTPGYSYLWDAAAGNQTTSSAVNLPAGTYVVMVADSNFCTSFISATVTEPQMLLAVIDTFSNPLCEGESSGFVSASASGGTGPIAFLWNNDPSANEALLSGVGAGTYEVTATDGNGCTATASVTLNDPPPLSVTIFPDDTAITYGDSITLRAVHSPANISPSYVWEPSDLPLWCVAPCTQPTIVPSESVTITVYITVQGSNCSASAEAVVEVEYDHTIYAPNAFSPNGDGENDKFEIFFSPSLKSITYLIFNRWGEKLFETHSLGDFWDGTYRGELLNPGVYVYWVEGIFLDGTKKTLKGSFTLLR